MLTETELSKGPKYLCNDGVDEYPHPEGVDTRTAIRRSRVDSVFRNTFNSSSGTRPTFVPLARGNFTSACTDAPASGLPPKTPYRAATERDERI